MENDLKAAVSDRVFITHSGCDRELVEEVRKYLESLGHFNEILETTAEAVAPAPAEAAAPAQNAEAIPDKPAKSPVTPAKTSPAPNQSTKKNPLIFAGIAAAILLILVVVFAVRFLASIQTGSLKGVLSVYKNGVVSNPNGTPLAGVLTSK